MVGFDNNILFIIPPYLVDPNKDKISRCRSFVTFPYGILSIASYLKKHTKENIKIFDCNLYDDYLHELLGEILSFNPMYIGISLMFDNSYQYLQGIIDTIRRESLAIITVGGQATTTSYKEILNDFPDVEAVCYGEGELSFTYLVKSVGSQGIFNPPWITRSSVMKGVTPQKVQVQDLDEVFDIDYSLIDVSKYGTTEEAFSPFMRKGERKQFFAVTTRGCPFKCRFCMNSENDDKKVRFASVDKIISHVEHLIATYGMNTLTFYDDQILYYKDRAKELFKKLAPYKLRIEMPNGITVAFIDEELAELMWFAGVDTLYLAFESGSDYVIKNFIHKLINLKKAKQTVNMLRQFPFWLLGYFVTGMPGETDDHRKETLDYIKDIGLDWVSFSPASPVRGSLLYKECIEKGYINSNLRIGTFDMTKYIINTPEYSSSYIMEQNYLMNLDINFVNNYRMKSKDYDTAKWAFQYVSNKYPDHALAFFKLGQVNIELGFIEEGLKNLMTVDSILEKSEMWRKYFKHFNLITGLKEFGFYE